MHVNCEIHYIINHWTGQMAEQTVSELVCGSVQRWHTNGWMHVKWTNKLTYDEPWPPREANQSCVSLFTLNDKTWSTVGSYIIIKPDVNKACGLVSMYPTFGPLSPLVPLTPAFPLFPCGRVCHVFQWGNRKQEGTHARQPHALCMNQCLQWLSEWLLLAISLVISCTHATISAWKFLISTK